MEDKLEGVTLLGLMDMAYAAGLINFNEERGLAELSDEGKRFVAFYNEIGEVLASISIRDRRI